MCCSRYKRRRQCTPRLSYDSCKGADVAHILKASLADLLQLSCAGLYLFTNRAKRQEKLGLLALFFCRFSSKNISKGLL